MWILLATITSVDTMYESPSHLLVAVFVVNYREERRLQLAPPPPLLVVASVSVQLLVRTYVVLGRKRFFAPSPLDLDPVPGRSYRMMMMPLMDLMKLDLSTLVIHLARVLHSTTKDSSLT